MKDAPKMPTSSPETQTSPRKGRVESDGSTVTSASGIFWKPQFMFGSFLTAILGIFLFCFRYIKEWLRYWQLAKRFPGPRPWPLIGNLLESGFPFDTDKAILYLVLKLIPKYRTFQFWIGPLRCIFINNPNDIQCCLQIAKNQYKTLIVTKFFGECMGNGLVCTNGKKWRRHHKIILPTFHPDHLATFVPTFNEKSDIFVKLLLKHAGGQSFDVKPMLHHLTFDIILGTAIGVSSNQQTDTDFRIFELVEQSQRSLCQRVGSPWLYPKAFFDISSAGKKMEEALDKCRVLLDKMIGERIQTIQEQKTAVDAGDEIQTGKKQICGVIDSMLHHMEKDDSITMRDIEDEVRTTMLAGFDTVAATVQLALYSLAWNPDVQKRAFLELQSVFGKDGSAEVTADTLHRMQYLEMVVKETLRLYPPVWLFTRQIGVDTPLPSCDLVIPKGSRVFISPKSLHLDPELFPNPEVFDPERFSPENSARRHPFAFLPFAGGIRGCIGKTFSIMEAKTILAKFLWHYEVKPDPLYTPTFTWGIATLPDNGTWIKIVKRS